MIPFPLGAWIRPGGAGGLMCWTRDGRASAGEGITAVNNPGILSQDSEGVKVRGSYLAKIGGFKFTDSVGFADGDATYYVKLDWTTMLGGIYGSCNFLFGNAVINESATDPWYDTNMAQNCIQMGLSGNVPYLQVHLQGSAHGGTSASIDIGPSVNSPFAKNTWTKIRVQWRNADGVRIWVNDQLCYENVGNVGWTFSGDAPIVFAQYGVFSVTDCWAHYKDISVCPILTEEVYQDFRTGNDIGTYTQWGYVDSHPNHFSTISQQSDGLKLQVASGNQNAYVTFNNLGSAGDFEISVTAKIDWTSTPGSGTQTFYVSGGLASPADGGPNIFESFSVITQSNGNINHSVLSPFTFSFTKGGEFTLKLVYNLAAQRVTVFMNGTKKGTWQLYSGGGNMVYGPIALGTWRWYDGDGFVVVKEVTVKKFSLPT